MLKFAGHAGLGGGQHVGAGAAGHVVHEHGQGDFVVDGLEVLEDALLRGLVVVGGDEQGGVGAGLFGEAGEADGFYRIIGACAGDDRHAALYLIHADADGGFMFGMGHGGGFAGGAAGHHAVHALFNLPFNVGAVGLFVDGAILERGKQSSYRTVKHVFLRAG